MLTCTSGMEQFLHGDINEDYNVGNDDNADNDNVAFNNY
jgi:hypothetical protein